MKLMGFNFDIQYRSRTSNLVADALPRINQSMECSNLTLPQWKHWDTLKMGIWVEPDGLEWASPKFRRVGS